jgi:Holliday junction resolvasome RuvABC endonuclease subunit
MSKILIAGLDGALVNFGVARMSLDLETNELAVVDLTMIHTKPDKRKQVRASSENYQRALQIHQGVTEAIKGCHVAFAEIPSGGQSYKAVIAFGIVTGIYASLPIPLIEVAPAETKLATVGTRTASKEEMVEWAFGQYPHANWKTVKRQGRKVPTQDNHNLADACAVVHAGILTPAFQQVRAILSASGVKLAA